MIKLIVFLPIVSLVVVVYLFRTFYAPGVKEGTFRMVLEILVNLTGITVVFGS